MYGKGEFSKIKGTICNVPVETSDVCKTLPRPADSNGLILVKLKRDLKYRGHVYFEPVRPTVVHNALNYLKSHNKFYEDISVRQDFATNDMINFCDSDTPANKETDETTEDQMFLQMKKVMKLLRIHLLGTELQAMKQLWYLKFLILLRMKI